MKRTITAHHEAGHAIASVAMGADLIFVELDTRPEVNMWAEAMARTESPNHWHRERIVHMLGGPIAQRMFTGRWSWSDAEGDLIQACATFYGGVFVDRDVMLTTWVRDAAATVAKHWPSIERVAKALLERAHLTGDEVRKLYREREPGRAPLPTADLKRLEKAIRGWATPEQLRELTPAEQTAAWLRSLGMPEKQIAKQVREMSRQMATISPTTKTRRARR